MKSFIELSDGLAVRAEVNEAGETVVRLRYSCGNYGWGPWFSLARQYGRWKFIKESSATEDVAAKKLTGVKGLHQNVQSWLKQRRV